MTDLPALLVANQNSRNGDDVTPFVDALIAGGMALRREPCPAGNLADRIRSLRSEISAVILGGGDGTMHAAAAALHETGLPLGILPLGTANDLARSLHLPDDPAHAADIILRGKTRTIDLGTVNDIPFFNVASLGLSVAVTRRLTGIMKRRFGMLAYPIAAAAAVLTTGRFSCVLHADDEEIATTTLQIAVGNGRYYGGGAVVHEDARIDDGLLNVYSLEPRARWRLLLLAPAFRAGEHRELSEVRTLTCQSLTVTTKRPRHIAADGEIVTRTPARFGVLPRAVRVFVP